MAGARGVIVLPVLPLGGIFRSVQDPAVHAPLRFDLNGAVRVDEANDAGVKDLVSRMVNDDVAHDRRGDLVVAVVVKDRVHVVAIDPETPVGEDPTVTVAGRVGKPGTDELVLSNHFSEPA